MSGDDCAISREAMRIRSGSCCGLACLCRCKTQWADRCSKNVKPVRSHSEHPPDGARSHTGKFSRKQRSAVRSYG